MNKSLNIQLFVRISLIICNAFFVYTFYKKGFSITLLFFIGVLCLQIFLFQDYLKGLFQDVEKKLDCLLHEDYSVSISSKKRKNSLYSKTALLIEKYRKKEFQQTSEQLIFNNILESLTIGILILRKDTKNEIEVFKINQAFTSFLKIPKYNNWSLLKEKIKPIATLIDNENWTTKKHVVTLNVNDESETFFFKTSITNTNKFDYLVLTLETIQQVIDKKEKESWYKLMNVMSHEIINTITPISSLASNLDSLLNEEHPDTETLAELSKGLQIIKKRSLHLTDFVSSYRKLAELPLPEKTQVNIVQLLQNTVSLFKQELEENNIKLQLETPKVILLLVDTNQIEQVFINLISNSLFALKTIKNPELNIIVSQTNTRVTIAFLDNGIGIPDDIKNNIFIPYFTTRKNGSGIGLTLSKNIMESHNGTIHFNTDNNKTVFTLGFKPF
ncbi:sensor histidine kinase [Lacinutrix chionoecetis]